MHGSHGSGGGRRVHAEGGRRCSQAPAQRHMCSLYYFFNLPAGLKFLKRKLETSKSNDDHTRSPADEMCLQGAARKGPSLPSRKDALPPGESWGSSAAGGAGLPRLSSRSLWGPLRGTPVGVSRAGPLAQSAFSARGEPADSALAALGELVLKMLPGLPGTQPEVSVGFSSEDAKRPVNIHLTRGSCSGNVSDTLKLSLTLYVEHPRPITGS